MAPVKSKSKPGPKITCQYRREKMHECIDKVRKKILSQREASRIYGIPSSTIQQRLSKLRMKDADPSLELKIQKKSRVLKKPTADSSHDPSVHTAALYGTDMDNSDDEQNASHCLEIVVQHGDNVHGTQKKNDVISYKFKYHTHGTSADLDLLDNASTYVKIDDKPIDFHFSDVSISIKTSSIDKYRIKNNYYGPLKVILKELEVIKDGKRSIVHDVKVQHISVDSKNNSSMEDLEQYIIPACEPPKDIEEKGRFLISFQTGEVFSILKRSIFAFRELSHHKGLVGIRMKKLFKPIRGKLTAITSLRIFPKEDLQPSSKKNDEISAETVNLKGKSGANEKKESADGESPHLITCHSQNFTNWRHRGTATLNELKKTGTEFINGVFTGINETSDPLGALGLGYSYLIEEDNIPEDRAYRLNNREAKILGNDELWQIATNLCSSDNTLIVLEFEVENGKWLEIKRTYNTFKVNGECHSDIVLKLAYTIGDGNITINYYLRCFGRLIKSGHLRTQLELKQLFNCLADDRYICIGIDKDSFMHQLDQNEFLKHHIEEMAYFVMHPFEAVHSKKCKGIIRHPHQVENQTNISNFTRGRLKISGTYHCCKPCATLKEKLSTLIDPELEGVAPADKPDINRLAKLRYAPSTMVKIDGKLRNLFTQTASEFVNSSRRQAATEQIVSSTTIQPKQKGPDLDDDFTKGPVLLPNIRVSEQEFANMIDFESNSDDPVAKKICQVCNFKTTSMLSLFTHMHGHLGPLDYACCNCKLNLSSPEALQSHLRMCLSPTIITCKKCFRNFASDEKLDDHMNIHRNHKPYKCHMCKTELSTLNEFKKHIKLQHNILTVKDLDFSCKFCGSYFYTSYHLLLHRVNNNHDQDSGFTCTDCKETAPNIAEFLQHISAHDLEACERMNVVPCSKCPKVFFSNYKLEQHLMLNHNVSSLNQSNYPASEENVSPMKVEWTAPNYHDKVADESFDDDGEAEDPLSINKFICKHCKRPFNSQFSYETHLKIHSSSSSVFQCEECGWVYRKRQSVLEHIRKAHIPPRDAQEEGEIVQNIKQENQDLDFLNTIAKDTSGWNSVKIANVGDSQTEQIYQILDMPEL